MSKLIFATRQGSLILGITYVLWALLCLAGGLQNYMFLGVGIVFLILVYDCLKGFSLSNWDFKEDFRAINHNLASIIWVYLTVLGLLYFFWVQVGELLGI